MWAFIFLFKKGAVSGKNSCIAYPANKHTILSIFGWVFWLGVFVFWLAFFFLDAM